MLRNMRNGALSMFFIGLLLLGGFGLVLTDWGGFFTGNVAPTNVAEVNGHEIPYQEFDNQTRQFLYERNIEPAIAYQAGIIDELLKQQIEAELLAQSGKNMGLNAPDYLIAERLRPIIDVMTSQGLSESQALTRFAQDQGTNPRRLIEDIRNNFTRLVLFTSLTGKDNVITRNGAQILYQYAQESRDVDLAYLPHQAITISHKVDDQELEDFYQSRKLSYATPEARDVKIAIFPIASIADDLAISDEELRSEYERLIDDYTLPETRRIEQIIISDEQSALDIKAKIENGVAFKKAANQPSQYRSPDNFSQDGLPPALADAVFTMEKDSVSAPIKTALGWHIIHVVDIIAPGAQPFDDVKQQLKIELTERQRDNLIYGLSAQIEDAVAKGELIDDIAKNLNLNLFDIHGLDSAGNLLNKNDKYKKNLESVFNTYSEDSDYILEQIFIAFDGETTPVMELQDGSLAIASIQSITPAGFEPLDAIKDELAKDWIAKEKTAKNFKNVQDMMTTLNELPTDEGAANKKPSFKKLATSAKGKFIHIKSIKRDMDQQDFVTPQIIQAIFDQEFTPANGNNAPYFMIPAQDGIVVGRINAVALPDLSTISADDLTQIKTNASAAISNEFIGLYVQHLAKNADIKINRALLKRLYAQQDDNSDI